MLKEEHFSAAIYDMRFAKPLDESLLKEVFAKFDKIITIEDGCLMGGFGSAIVEFMSDNGYRATVKRLGIPDEIIEHGTQMELHKQCGFDPESIYLTALELVGITAINT
jgi:1-deoxy-D-xylulose-5-phosphate synthase